MRKNKLPILVTTAVLCLSVAVTASFMYTDSSTADGLYEQYVFNTQKNTTGSVTVDSVIKELADREEEVEIPSGDVPGEDPNTPGGGGGGEDPNTPGSGYIPGVVPGGKPGTITNLQHNWRQTTAADGELIVWEQQMIGPWSSAIGNPVSMAEDGCWMYALQTATGKSMVDMINAVDGFSCTGSDDTGYTITPAGTFLNGQAVNSPGSHCQQYIEKLGINVTQVSTEDMIADLKSDPNCRYITRGGNKSGVGEAHWYVLYGGDADEDGDGIFEWCTMVNPLTINQSVQPALVMIGSDTFYKYVTTSGNNWKVKP